MRVCGMQSENSTEKNTVPPLVSGRQDRQSREGWATSPLYFTHLTNTSLLLLKEQTGNHP